MGTDAMIDMLADIAVPTQDLKANRITISLQPKIERRPLATTPYFELASMFRSIIVDMVYSKEFNRALAATLTISPVDIKCLVFVYKSSGSGSFCTFIRARLAKPSLVPTLSFTTQDTESLPSEEFCPTPVSGNYVGGTLITSPFATNRRSFTICTKSLSMPSVVSCLFHCE